MDGIERYVRLFSVSISEGDQSLRAFRFAAKRRSV